MRINNERDFYSPQHQSQIQLCEVFGPWMSCSEHMVQKGSTSERDSFFSVNQQ